MSNWLQEAIALEAKYDEGYKAGKAAAAKELLDDLEETLIAKLEAFNRIQEDPTLASPLKHEPEYWRGRAVTCGEILRIISIKKKYEYGVN